MNVIVVVSPNGCLIDNHRQQVVPEAAGKEKGIRTLQKECYQTEADGFEPAAL